MRHVKVDRRDDGPLGAASRRSGRGRRGVLLRDMAFSADASPERSPLRRLIQPVLWALGQRLAPFVIVRGITTLFGYGDLRSRE